MSRTDKTNPFHVKWFYKPTYLEPVHRHETHDCNLPPKPTPKDASNIQWYGKWDAPCFWWPSMEFMRSPWAKCPCKMCRMGWWTTTEARKDRRKARRYTQDGWKTEY